MAHRNEDPEFLIGRTLKKRGLRLALAESCTGGLASSLVTNVPGSSDYFLGSVVAYDNAVKRKMLGVSASTLKAHGAVSAETAVEMAEGVKKALKADVGVSITGIAGPDGGTRAKPVGTVYVCVAALKKPVVREFHFSGTRASIKTQSARGALELLIETLR